MFFLSGMFPLQHVVFWKVGSNNESISSHRQFPCEEALLYVQSFQHKVGRISWTPVLNMLSSFEVLFGTFFAVEGSFKMPGLFMKCEVCVNYWITVIGWIYFGSTPHPVTVTTRIMNHFYYGIPNKTFICDDCILGGGYTYIVHNRHVYHLYITYFAQIHLAGEHAGTSWPCRCLQENYWHQNISIYL